MSAAWTIECQGCGIRAVMHVPIHSARCFRCSRSMKVTETTNKEAMKWFKRKK